MAPTKTCSSAGAANSEEATAEKKKIQAALKNKCSAKEIFEIMEFLKDKTTMMEAVEEMGLGSLKYLPVVDMKLKFAKELLDAFDVSSCSIFGESIKAEDVNRILGIPSTGKSVPTDIFSDKKETLKEKFANKSVSQLREDIKGFKSVDDTFRETFFLFVLARFLCPTSKDFPSTKLYKALQVVSNARQYNWGEFVLAWLVKHISDCKEKGASHNVGVGGCIYFLMIFVLQWKYPQHIDDSKPVMSAWTKKKITRAIKKKIRRREKSKATTMKGIRCIITKQRVIIAEQRVTKVESLLDSLTVNGQQCCSRCIANEQRLTKSKSILLSDNEADLVKLDNDVYRKKILDSLEPGKYVHADVLSCYVSYLKRTMSSKALSRSLLLDTYTYSKLERDYGQVMKKWSCWWKGNLDEYSYIVLPICTK